MIREAETKKIVDELFLKLQQEIDEVQKMKIKEQIKKVKSNQMVLK